MADMRLFSVWKAQRSKDFFVQFHSHNYYELVYYTFGNGETHIGEQTYSFCNNSFAIIPPNVEHNEHHRSNSQVICAGFSYQGNLQKGLYKDPDGEVLRVVKELLNETKNQSFGYKEMIGLRLKELILYILRGKNNVAKEKSFEYIINYLKENYRERIVLSDCAKQLSISYDYFQHKFKSLTGYSPRQFLVEQRLSVAENMLKSEELSCTAVAYRCGFSTSAQFSALFKKKHGISPLQFRKREKDM